MLRQIEGSRAVAEAVALSRPEVICAYPISPQTHIVEALGLEMEADNENDENDAADGGKRTSMAGGPFVDARGQAFVLVARSRGGDEAAIAVGTVDEAGAAHFQPDARVAQRAADALAGDAVRMDDHHFGGRPDRRRRHGVGGHVFGGRIKRGGFAGHETLRRRTLAMRPRGPRYATIGLRVNCAIRAEGQVLGYLGLAQARLLAV